MLPAHRRHDINERTWKLLEPHLPGREGVWGGRAQDNRRFINAVFWILRTGAPWRDLPPDYGGWSNTHRRFIRWRDKGHLGGVAGKIDRRTRLRMAHDRCQSHQSSSPRRR